MDRDLTAFATLGSPMMSLGRHRASQAGLYYRPNREILGDRRLETHLETSAARRPTIPARRASEGLLPERPQGLAATLAGASGWCGHDRIVGLRIPTARLN